VKECNFFPKVFFLEKLKDFVFTTSFKLNDGLALGKIQKLLELELRHFDDLSNRIHDLSITSDDGDGITIQFHANDYTSYKIVVSSIMRYIEIIGKTMELIREQPASEDILRTSS